MITSPQGTTRKPPKVSDENEPIARQLRLQDEENVRRHRNLAEKVPGDRFDEIEFTSSGEDEEIRLSNTLGYQPNRSETVCVKGGAYSVYEPRENMADDDFIYLSTNAPEGTRFVVRFYRMD